MENDKSDMEEFNEKILAAFAVKFKKQEQDLSELEQSLSVKEAELDYLAKQSINEKTLLTLEVENANKKIDLLEKKISEATTSISKKDEKIVELKAKLDDLTNKLIPKDEKLDKLKSEIDKQKKEIDDLNNKNTELNKFFVENEPKLKEINSKERLIEELAYRIKDLEAELGELKPEMVVSVSLSGDRLACVKCGAVGKNIKVIEDKTKPLAHYGNRPTYAKINVCKKCGYEF